MSDLWEQENSPRYNKGTVKPGSALQIIWNITKILFTFLGQPWGALNDAHGILNY